MSETDNDTFLASLSAPQRGVALVEMLAADLMITPAMLVEDSPEAYEAVRAGARNGDSYAAILAAVKEHI